MSVKDRPSVDQSKDIERTKRIMAQLAKIPNKPHVAKRKTRPAHRGRVNKGKSRS